MPVKKRKVSKKTTSGLFTKQKLILILTLATLLSIPLTIGHLNNVWRFRTQAQTVPSAFVFTAAGDHGRSTKIETLATMDAVAQSGSDFYIALGDLSYQVGGEQAWCNAFKSRFNDVELIAGNHDVGESTGGNIDTYITYCPYTLTGLNGDYGKQYYFDYPQTGTPLARFILISPGIKGSLNIDYNPGGAGYIFTQNAINDAKAKGIKWLVVGMHKNCISTGQKSCEVGSSLMSLLINSKVDLILQGHDHNYQRSHGVSCITQNTVNPACITDDGSDGTYVKGHGSVININGEFGQSHYAVNTADTEASYFAKLDDTTFGITKYTVSDTQIAAQYMQSSGGGFADTFTIIDTSVPTATPDLNTPTPTPTDVVSIPTETPTPTPTFTPTPTPLPAQTFYPTADSFVGSDFPTRNNGTSARLESDGNPKKIVYMKYDLRSLAGKQLRSAKLRMKVLDTSVGTQNMRLVSNTSWTETGITYNNRPALGNTFQTFPGGTTGNFVEVDITSGLTSSLGKVITIAIESTNSDGYDFASRTNSVVNDRVRLLLTVQ